MDVIVVIDKIFVACVVWWIDIDDVDFSGVGVGEGGECFEVVALDEYMVGGIGAGSSQRAAFVLSQNGQVVTKPFFRSFGLVFPYKSIGFGFAEKSEKCRALVVGQPLQGVDAVD